MDDLVYRICNFPMGQISQDDYSPFLRYDLLMFQGPQSWRDFVIRCKGCGENVPAMVETLPASWIAVKCPLCGEHRRYLPTEVFQGRVSYKLIRSRHGA